MELLPVVETLTMKSEEPPPTGRLEGTVHLAAGGAPAQVSATLPEKLAPGKIWME